MFDVGKRVIENHEPLGGHLNSASSATSEMQKPKSFRIVGIGASAGGRESLEQLFADIPAETGVAFVVVQHLSPDFRSMMDELFPRHSDMPVRLAEHEVQVEPNHIYLLPPGKEMTIKGAGYY
jgi:two-component system CheB/CheR fusion protein